MEAFSILQDQILGTLSTAVTLLSEVAKDTIMPIEGKLERQLTYSVFNFHSSGVFQLKCS